MRVVERGGWGGIPPNGSFSYNNTKENGLSVCCLRDLLI